MKIDLVKTYVIGFNVENFAVVNVNIKITEISIN